MKLLIITLLSLTSCASYVQSLHRQIDNEQYANKRTKVQRQQGSDRRPLQNPQTLSWGANANQGDMPPNVKRNYTQSVGKKRYTADDLRDNGDDGSLWSGENTENFLFVTNNLKKRGDIVIIEVMSSMKNKIQDELKRAFPDRPVKKSDSDKKEGDNETPPAQVAQEDTKKVYDKISTTVVERMNQDYLLVRGRKEVMFKERKRFIEVQTVVSQKDISSSDTISSEKTLEPKINVLRY